MKGTIYMANYRQTNHNGRVSAKTGTVYNRNHNDRNFDVSHADNINSEMIMHNLIIHYDEHNTPTVISSNNSNRKSIDTHEHEIYEKLFSESICKQNARNIAIRHPERNKTIEDKLNDKNTCPEETVFQIGSLEDGFPDPSILIEIFEEFQEELIHRYGNNLHFLDATLHLDEAVPHIHIRKVWTYDGKDGLDISQNKALIEMNFERPHPDKPRNKYNNEKMTFSAFERDLKLLICQKHGLDVEHTPKHPGKASLEKEEAIALKLQEKNQEYREETERLIDERNHILSDKDHDIAKKEAQLEKVSAELVSEEQKNREIADTNIFGKPKNITMSAQEFRSWQKSAETKESNELALKAISKGKKDNEAYEKRLLAFKKELDARELSINSTIAKGIADGIKEQLPDAIKQEKRNITIEKGQLTRRKNGLDAREDELIQRESKLSDEEYKVFQKKVTNDSVAEKLSQQKLTLDKREKNLDKEVLTKVKEIITEKLEAFFSKFLKPIFKRFKGSHQDEVLSVLDQMPIDHTSAQKLVKLGYPNLEGHPYEEALDIAEQRDIYLMLQEHDSSINPDDISENDYDNLIDSIRDGMSVKDATIQLANNLAERYVPVVRRRGGR